MDYFPWLHWFWPACCSCCGCLENQDLRPQTPKTGPYGCLETSRETPTRKNSIYKYLSDIDIVCLRQAALFTFLSIRYHDDGYELFGAGGLNFRDTHNMLVFSSLVREEKRLFLPSPPLCYYLCLVCYCFPVNLHRDSVTLHFRENCNLGRKYRKDINRKLWRQTSKGKKP